jgi:hypothetical protein
MPPFLLAFEPIGIYGISFDLMTRRITDPLQMDGVYGVAVREYDIVF